MSKLRFLQGLYIPSLGKVVNFNDEIEVKDEKLVNCLTKNGYADKLIEPENELKPTKKAPKRVQKTVKQDA